MLQTGDRKLSEPYTSFIFIFHPREAATSGANPTFRLFLTYFTQFQ